MSKQRQRRRAMEAQKARAPKAQARAREEQRPASTLPRKAPKADRRAPVYRQRRFPPLPVWLKLLLAVVWLGCLLLVALFVPTWTGRIGFMVIATMLLPLIVVVLWNPTRRTRR